MGRTQNSEQQEAGGGTIWKDRKHHLWFPLSFTKYEVADGRLYVTTGILSSREDECLLYRITDISLTRSFAQRIFGTGTIELVTQDRSTPVICLENIANSSEVRRILSKLIEKERKEKEVVMTSPYGLEEHGDHGLFFEDE